MVSLHRRRGSWEPDAVGLPPTCPGMPPKSLPRVPPTIPDQHMRGAEAEPDPALRPSPLPSAHRVPRGLAGYHARCPRGAVGPARQSHMWGAGRRGWGHRSRGRRGQSGATC